MTSGEDFYADCSFLGQKNEECNKKPKKWNIKITF